MRSRRLLGSFVARKAEWRPTKGRGGKSAVWVEAAEKSCPVKVWAVAVIVRGRSP